MSKYIVVLVISLIFAGQICGRWFYTTFMEKTHCSQETRTYFMKYLIYSIILLAIVLIGYNITILDFKNLLQDDSGTAAMAILASLCVVVLMVILLISRSISKKHKE